MVQLVTYQFEWSNFKTYYDDSNNILHILDISSSLEHGGRSVTNTADLIERKFVKEINENVRLFLYGTDNMISEFSTRHKAHERAISFQFVDEGETLIYRPFVKEMYEINSFDNRKMYTV